MDVAVGACKQAWERAMQYCSIAFDDKSKSSCKAWKADPQDFLDNNILRAPVNPIDGGKTCAPSAVRPSGSGNSSSRLHTLARGNSSSRLQTFATVQVVLVEGQVLRLDPSVSPRFPLVAKIERRSGLLRGPSGRTG